MRTPRTNWPRAAVALACLFMIVPASAQEVVGSSNDPLTVGKPKQVPGQCRQGYVWREARPGDKVCVSPATRDAVAAQNHNAKRLWISGPYGPRTCRDGYVWREAFDGDQVCVTPQVRAETRRDNELAPRRRL